MTAPTWYVLEDGDFADPAEVAPDAQGVLRHKSGVAVSVGKHGPRTRSMGDDEIVAARGRQVGRDADKRNREAARAASPPSQDVQQPPDGTVEKDDPAPKPGRGKNREAAATAGGARYETR